jgi:hypothetical protein
METETKTIRRNVDVPLHSSEIADYGRQLAEIEGQILSLEEQRVQAKRQFKSQLILLEQRKAILGHLIRKGSEVREVEIVEVKDFSNKVVRYLHGPRLVDSRPMTEDDLQVRLPGTYDCPSCGAKETQACDAKCERLLKAQHDGL